MQLLFFTFRPLVNQLIPALIWSNLKCLSLLNKKFLYGYSLDINFTYRGELSGHCEVSGITACVEGFMTD